MDQFLPEKQIEITTNDMLYRIRKYAYTDDG